MSSRPLHQDECLVASISYLANTTATALTAVENKIPSVSNLVKKTNYNTKTNKIEKKISDDNHDKCIATLEFNKLTLENSVARLKQKNLTSISGIANFVNKADLNNKLKELHQRKMKKMNYQKKLKQYQQKINKRFDK